MKGFLNRVFKKINTPEILIFLFVILFGTLLLLNNRFEYITFYNAYDYEVVSVTAYDEENHNLNSELFKEINVEIEKNNIASEIKLDSASNTVIMYRKNFDFAWFTDWCIYLSNRALINMRNKKKVQVLYQATFMSINAQQVLRKRIDCNCGRYHKK